MTSLVWDNLERRYPVRRNQPNTWTVQRVNGLHALDKSASFDEIGSASVSQMLDDVPGSGNWQRPARLGYLLIAFPEPRGQWDVPFAGWHLDFPASDSLEGLFLVRPFTCLQHLPHRGGATLAVAGSHLLVEDLIRKHADRQMHSADVRKALIRSYSWMKALCSRGERADRIERFMDLTGHVGGAQLRVVEMTGEPGDVFLVHPLILHTASRNCANVPRMVLSSFVYRHRVDPSRIPGVF